MNARLMICTAVALALSTPTLAALQTSADLPSGNYGLDRKHASIVAKVLHLGVSYYTVRFDTFDAGFTYDPANPSAAKVRATVDATSLDVGAPYARRFADEFLDATKNPVASFVSTQILPAADGRTGTMTGNLTLHGVTRPVSFAVTFVGVGHGLFGGTITGFSAITKIKRSDFGSTFLLNLVGDDTEIDMDVEFDRK